MKKLLGLLFLLPYVAHCQSSTSTISWQGVPDTGLSYLFRDVIVLTDATVHAYNADTGQMELGAAVGVVYPSGLQNNNDRSIVSAVNQVPGVRMEERSPSSYRISFRGSTLRSPFGVRNVKVYYNDMPITDPAGITYLNQFSYYDLTKLELIKGPGSSLYGAGTGGAMLIMSNYGYTDPENYASLYFTAGSDGYSSIAAALHTAKGNNESQIIYQHLSSDGYRKQSSSRHDVISWDATARWSDKDQLSASFLYSDLMYQTPGGLTLAEYEKDPQSARPATATLPGAEQQQATIYQKNFLGGFTYSHQLNSLLNNQTTVYGAFTQMLNPAIRNYGRNKEMHFGGRTTFEVRKTFNELQMKWLLGAEVQQGLADSKTYQNKNGVADTLLTDDEISVLSYFGFTQLSLNWNKWILTAGLSLNQSNLNVTRLSLHPTAGYDRKFDNGIAPRISLLRLLGSHYSVYASASKGFSPPTVAELSPSGSTLNPNLLSESGWNYEAGIKGAVIHNRLSFGLSVFSFLLDHSIVARKDSLGGDNYINSGKTKEQGMELQLNYRLPAEKIIPVTFWMAYTWYHFRYQEFQQFSNDYSGNQVPGAAPNTLAAGLDLDSKYGVYLHLSYFYSDKIMLDDANKNTASAYQVVGARLGWNHSFKKAGLEIFAGGDNLLDETYSLGNDINASGGRFYNAAPGRNFYAGISLKPFWK